MNLFYHPLYSALPLPAHHRFPIDKYRLLHERLMLHPELSKAARLRCAEPISQQQLALAHTPEYIADFIDGTLPASAQKRIGFPHSDTLVARTLQSVGNSLGAAYCALEHGLAINLAGGYHHAFAGHGSGYCIFNDLAIAARELIHQGRVDTVLLLDLDVHQGDGSASILDEDENIITLSLHGEQNFPRLKQRSDYDFPLPTGCDDGLYLETLETALNLVLRLHQPDIILYNAGADVVAEDELGTLSLSLEAVRQRDTQVMTMAKEKNIPLCCALGGGYQRNLEQVVDVHWQLLLSAYYSYK
ncbi:MULTISPECIES: histone deacetylase family protein [unclassified Pseudoalteromonas]|uniref:histone deacetylase family protein n=1 Tax=unclassified Pseudoalteromonas TaxID=194690 RepID=UPI000CF6D79D|nr:MULTISPECIES: histone deacetylase [unclassified Pseudoalteromonas]MBS3798627.1 histone deacetylase [Pseudoalteromonas sp. BDTF-M6]